MPAATKTFMPALATFIALSFTYTAVVARKEGNTIDAARTRWQQQRAHAGVENSLLAHH
ncbi:hypothetical protein GQ43DRAFT_284552 [Delitschia confertaspora ATCC 74209]|uniref:Uncharacterized protein n=1 Tax=Delitschia confertaspora ATCC 74209 TaxID=1513339 RepID=A0A9P4JV34_9PLEO|nr:hypothetical protein GQ43DRAFT_284552 [Delitschia confertaspora ATCC 74209]